MSNYILTSLNESENVRIIIKRKMMKQRQTNKFYKRLEKYKDKSGSSDEETELFVRNKSPKREIPTIEKEIEEGDTLQSLAIRYHCTIEDLKRINSIHKENEIYARRTIKVPHRPFSDALAAVHISGTSSPTEFNEPTTSRLIDVDSLESKLELTQEKNNEVNQIIFNSNITQKIPEPGIETIMEPDESIHLLPQNLRLPEADPVISRLSCNGSDWDISYPALIVCIVIVIFAIPLIYVFYIAEHPEIYQNNTNVNGS